jgi:DNA-binding NarL/FixJ family response regulator
MPFRVLICDDHPIVLESLSLLISTMKDLEVVGALTDPRDVLKVLSELEVNVILTDMNMPSMDGITLISEVIAHYPEMQILMLTVSEDEGTIRRAFRAGAKGYVMKKADRRELEHALLTVANGNQYFSSEVLKGLIGSGDEPPLRDSVTKRELEIIRLIAQEMSTAEIAEKLFLSTGTVETHRHNILRKLGVKNAIGIIKYAMKHNLV